MPITALPALDRTSLGFKADVDTFFGTQLPAFSTQAEAARVEINAKESSATAAAAAATTKAGEAVTSANAAALSNANSSIARDAAVLARTGAEAALDSFDDRYLGPKAAPPTLDNDGAVLLVGSLYWDTSMSSMRGYNGTAWVTLPAATAGAVANSPAAGITETNMQGAINGLETRKVATSISLVVGTNLNTVVTSGFYRFIGAPVNGPGVGDSLLIVSRGNDTIAQIVVNFASGITYTRAGSPADVGGAGVWSAWLEQASLTSVQTLSNKTISAAGRILAAPTTGVIGSATNPVALEAISAGGAGDAAFMQFQRPGFFGVKFGLDTDNHLKVGGYSHGLNAYRIFSQNNILGTVNQAAGVPTGAIIERGSNANGAFVRWADGTQLCTGTFPDFAMAANGIAGPAAQSFSAAFVAPISVVSYQQSPSLTADFYGCVYESSASLAVASPVFRNGALAQTVGFIRYLAIGRWF